MKMTCQPLLLNSVNPSRLPPLAILAATFPKPSDDNGGDDDDDDDYQGHDDDDDH